MGQITLIYRPHSSGVFVVHHTSFAELDHHTIENVRTAYESLPNYTTLKFEALDEDNMRDAGLDKPNVVPIRLMLGYMTHNRSSIALHAYICTKDHLSKIYLRLGDKPLIVRWLDHLNLDAPFDIIYDNYGMTRRAIDRLSTMAAYYFLAAGYVEAVTTRSDYRVAFAALCKKIQPLHGPGAWNYEDKTATDTTRGLAQYTTTTLKAVHQDLYLPEGGLAHSESTTTSREPTTEIAESKLRSKRHLGCNKITAHSHFNSGHSSTGSAQPIESRGKTPDIDDFTSFISTYTRLKADNIALITGNNEVRHLRAQLDESRLREKAAVDITQRARAESNTKTALIASIRKELQESREKEEEASKKFVSMRYNLGLQEVKTRSAEISREAAEKKVQHQAVEIGQLTLAKDHLEEQLKNIASQEELELEVQTLKAEKEKLGAKNESLKGQVGNLEKEIRDMREKFTEYKRIIRAASTDL